MADAIDFSKTHRIVLLIDLNPLLQSPNPNPNYITTILTTSKILLSFNSLSSSLFSFKLFFSSLSTLLSASTLHRILPNHPSASLSFNSPSQTLNSLANTLNSIPPTILGTQLTCSYPNCSHTASSLLQLVKDHDWEVWESDTGDIRKPAGKLHRDLIDIRSNMVILLSPICRSLKSLAEFMRVDVSDDCLRDLDGCRWRFRDCFRGVSDAFSCKDIHFCWADIRSNLEESEVNGSEEQSVFIRNEISKLGWGFCSSDLIILGSALVPFGLIYPNIVMPLKFLDSRWTDVRISGQLNLDIIDVSGKPLECHCCDLELLHLKASSKPRASDIFRSQEVGSLKAQHLNLLNTFLDSLNDEAVRLRVTAVQKHTNYEYLEEFCSESVLVQSAESGKKRKDGLENVFANRAFELLAGEKVEIFGKNTVPTWQIFLSFLYKEGYWALLSLSNSNGDSYMGILKPFTVHSAILLVIDNYHNLIQNRGGMKLLMNENVSQLPSNPQMGMAPLGIYDHVGDGKRRKMKKQKYQELSWTSFCKAAYECLDVDLAEVYFASGIKNSKKLKFLKCWMKEVKIHSLSLNNKPPGSSQTVQDVNQQKETDTNEKLVTCCQESEEHPQLSICSDQSRMQDDVALVSCSETSESFFSNLPKKIQHGVESFGIDLKILAERLVSSSIYWLGKKHETMEIPDEHRTLKIAEVIKLLLREPQDLKEHKDYKPSSTSEYLVREYELQILLRLEILQSEYAGSIKEFMKMKLVKQICSLLEIIQYLVEGGFHGDLSLYDYVERTIKTRYSKNLGDVVEKIYDQMDLLPFGVENDEALMFNSEDSNQSWRGKSERIETSASKMVQDSLSVEDESYHLLEKVNVSHEGDTKEDHARLLNEAREKRERARRLVSFGRRMPDLQRVWALKQSKPMKVKSEPKRKKQMGVSYSVVYETPLTGNNPSCPTHQHKRERDTPVSKALFQDDR